MILMTFAITIAFLVRSSSLVGWIPLAIYKMFQSWPYFVAILQAGVFIAVPVVCFSVFLDSLYYGTLTFPQLNFVYLNVVDNLSKYFGVSPTFYYFNEIKNFILASEKFFPMIIFAMCFFTLYQMNGRIPLKTEAGSNYSAD